MKTDVVVTMTLDEVKDLRESTLVAMEALKEKVKQLEVGFEKNMAIHSYKMLEEFKNTITY